MAPLARIGRLVGRGRDDQAPVYALHTVAIVVGAIVAVALAISFTLWALLS